MKKSIIYLLLLTSGMMSCRNNDESVFSESTDVRLNAALAAYTKELAEAPYGWNAVIYPKGGGSYGFYFKFDDKNRVVMYSDFADASAATSKESSYRLKALQTPTLIFDTYSYLHVLSDPDPNVNDGSTGLGLESDFEFSIFADSVKAERIVLIGTKNQSKLVLTKAVQAEATAFTNGNFAKGLLFNNLDQYITYFKRVTIGGVTYEISMSKDNRTIKLTWLDGSVAKSVTSQYYYSATGITFVTPIVAGTQTIKGFTDVTWDANNLILGVKTNGVSGSVVSADKPLKAEVAAPRRWWSTPIETGGLWRSVDGFHVNGKDDAFGVNTLKNGILPYVFYIYQPAINPSYDLFGPGFEKNGSLAVDYWYATRTPTFTTDGKIVFSLFGVAGTVPTSGPAFETINLLYEKTGYYLIQTGDTSYDMVSAKDAKSWISWF